MLNWAVGGDLSHLGELGEAPKIVQEQGLSLEETPDLHRRGAAAAGNIDFDAASAGIQKLGAKIEGD